MGRRETYAAEGRRRGRRSGGGARRRGGGGRRLRRHVIREDRRRQSACNNRFLYFNYVLYYFILCVTHGDERARRPWPASSPSLAPSSGETRLTMAPAFVTTVSERFFICTSSTVSRAAPRARFWRSGFSFFSSSFSSSFLPFSATGLPCEDYGLSISIIDRYLDGSSRHAAATTGLSLALAWLRASYRSILGGTVTDRRERE